MKVAPTPVILPPISPVKDPAKPPVAVATPVTFTPLGNVGAPVPSLFVNLSLFIFITIVF